MKKMSIAALTLLALAGTAFADPHETQTFAGPYGTYAPRTNPLNTTLSATFTGVDAGTPYTPAGLSILMDLASVEAFTWAYDISIRVVPPSGPVFFVYPSEEEEYTTITDAVIDIQLPAGVNPIGTWTFQIYDSYQDGAGGAESNVSNVRISLQNLPPVEPPTNTDLGTLTSTDITTTVPDFNGVDIVWYKITLPDAADLDSGYYVDLNTVGSTIGAGESELADDTMMAVYDSNGLLYNYNDDIAYPAAVTSRLTFGSDTVRDHGVGAGVYNGASGDLPAGDYYVAVSAYYMDIGDTGFAVTSESLSAGGSLTLNVFSNFPGAPTNCSPADLGIQGGEEGQDRHLDNNDFIVFINYFFAHDARADVGRQGGEHGSDAAWDNNDFVAFIDFFFNDAAACNG
jgi:hypothetical protein